MVVTELESSIGKLFDCGRIVRNLPGQSGSLCLCERALDAQRRQAIAWPREVEVFADAMGDSERQRASPDQREAGQRGARA